MFELVPFIVSVLARRFRSRMVLELENLALRHQLQVLRRQRPGRPPDVHDRPLPGINWWRTADLWVTLMREVLGYSKFAAEGGDWGAFVTQQLGHKYPKHLFGIYLTLSIPMDFSAAESLKESDYGADEQAALARTREARPSIISHVAVQTRDPQTLAYGMHDSPVALLAWMLERRRAWSDCGGNVERRYTKDELLTHIMLYWVTECFVTSVRYYYEARPHPWTPSHDRMPVVEAPTRDRRLSARVAHPSAQVGRTVFQPSALDTDDSRRSLRT
jgi:hypothetical protein